MRYTLITLLGLIRASNAGFNVGLDIDGIWTAALSKLDSSHTTPGDIGLYLWVDSELTGENTSGLLQKLEGTMSSSRGWSDCVGMEVGWIIVGTISAARRRGSIAAVTILNDLVQSVCSQYVSNSGLLFHSRTLNSRRRFPNFATEIYNVYALCSAAQFLEDERLLTVARQIADRLLALQLPCGGWPWLYDAERGSVVERYEIYSVHQDGMAPMALLKLSELSGEIKYAQAAFKGVDWLYSSNELNYNMVDEKDGFICRSIRRRKPFNILLNGANTSLSILNFQSDVANGQFLEINSTCRPYCLGWILFAWAGKEHGSAASRTESMEVYPDAPDIVP